MCRLGGVALGTMKRSTQFYHMLAEQLAELLVNMDVAQGGDGVGVAIHYPNGARKVLKTADRAWKAYRYLWPQVEEALPGAVAVQMHARLATCGDSSNPNNLHPIERGSVVGAHNGIILNDDEIFEYMELERKGQVDSEAIFALVEAIAPDLDLEGIQTVLDCLAGSFAFTVASTEAPGKVLLVAGNGQLMYARQKQTGLVWWASTSGLLPLSALRGSTVVSMELGDTAVVHTDEPKPRVELYELKVAPRHSYGFWYEYGYGDGYDGWDCPVEGAAGRAADPSRGSAVRRLDNFAEWDRQVSRWEARARRKRHQRGGR